MVEPDACSAGLRAGARDFAANVSLHTKTAVDGADGRPILPMVASLPVEQFIHVSLRDLVQNRHPTETEGAATADCA